MRPVRMAARALLGTIFVASGARALANPDGLVPRAKPVADRVGPALQRVSPHLPSDSRSLVKLNAAAQLTGGLLLATGHLTRPAAAVLAGSLVPTTFAGHPFWTFESPDERQNHRMHFAKNLGLLGGLLLAAADTEGRPGLRWRAGHAADRTQRNVRRMARTARREARIAAMAAGAGRRLPRK
jgi:putative oxidoreductase